MREITYAQAITEAMRDELRRDPAVFLIGEDIGKHGGAFGVTKGLWDEFGSDRVRNTPICENTIVGTALGAALTGMRPVAEIMFADFSTLAMDQIINQAAKIRYMTGGQVKAPMVVRMPQGGGGRKGTAAQHSQTLEVLFAHIPGLRVVMPSTPADAKGLMAAAIRDDNPVVYFEDRTLYTMRGEVPDGDHVVPIGVADVKRQGNDVTVIATQNMMQESLKAAALLDGEGISVEVLDPRTLKPLDEEAIVRSVKKTHRAVVVQEACSQYGTANEWAMVIMQHAFDWLDAAITKVASLDVPIPFDNPEEVAVFPTAPKIAQAVRDVVRGREEAGAERVTA